MGLISLISLDILKVSGALNMEGVKQLTVDVAVIPVSDSCEDT